jgi:hypothetical protein
MKLGGKIREALRKVELSWGRTGIHFSVPHVV